MDDATRRKAGGRPRQETTVVQISLSLHPGEDDDLIAFFASLPQRGRARAVIAALRTGNIGRALAGEGLDDDQMAEHMLASFLR
jgi:hypothetical protein